MDSHPDRGGWQYRAPYDEEEPSQCVHDCHRQGCCGAPWTVICIPVPLETNVQSHLQRCFRDLGCYFDCCHRHHWYNDHYLEDDGFNYCNDWPSNDRHLPNQTRRMYYDDCYDASFRPAEDMACSDNGTEMYRRRRNNGMLKPTCTSDDCRDDRWTACREQAPQWNAYSDNRRGEDQFCANFEDLNIWDQEPTATSGLRHHAMGKCEYGARRRYSGEMYSQPNETAFGPGKPRRHEEGTCDGFYDRVGERNMTTPGVDKAKTKKKFTVPLPDVQVYFPWNEKLPSDIATVSPEDLASIEAEDGWACGFVHEPHSNLRPVVIDGSNVAMAYYDDGRRYSALAISHAVEYFLRRGHPVVAMLSRGHLEENSSYKVTDGYAFSYLLARGLVILTPVINWNSRKGPMRYTPYEDHFIAEQAYLSGGIIVSNDSFRDVAAVNPSWKAMLLSRVIRFGWDENGNFELRSKGGPLSEWTLKTKLFFNKNEKVYQVVKPVSEKERKEILSLMHRFDSHEDATSW